MHMNDDEVTWPYLAAEVDASLQPALIERHAQEILARAALHGRLVAFLGAGVSMAFGRLSWPQLVYRVMGAVAEIDEDRYRAQIDPHRQICARLRTLQQGLGLLEPVPGVTSKRRPARRAVNDLGAGKPLLVLQLCAEVLTLAKRCEKANGRADVLDLGELFAQALCSPQVHDVALAKLLEGWPALVGRDRLQLKHLFGFLHKLNQQLKRGSPPQLAQRQHFLRVLVKKIAGRRNEKPRDKSLHDNGEGSPVALLMHEFGVRRFATTNYDNEIEAALLVGDRKPDGLAQQPGDGPEDSSPVDLRQHSLDLEPRTAAAALAFAVEGRRRHAAVLHLHGHIDRPKGMIASERDYQTRYLRQSTGRDLLDNAIRTLFGANPVLYVGSGIQEDDVLRPLREFMSRAPRRGDRLGVALLPATRPESELTLQKIDSLVRFGIHVIHYGYTHVPTDREAAPGVPQRAWLGVYADASIALKRYLDLLVSAPKPAPPGRPQPDTADVNTLTTVEPPSHLEGQDCDGGTGDIKLECLAFNALVEDCRLWCLPGRPPVGVPDRDAVHMLIDDITASITTAFVCARLMFEHRFRQNWSRQLARPIAPVHTNEPLVLARPPGQPVGCDTYRHMAIDLTPFCSGVPNRFATAAGVQSDSRWAQLFNGLLSHKAFRETLGRRMVLIPVPRGAGKGSMFDQLTVPDSATLQALRNTLAHPTRPCPDWRSALISLNFLSDVSNVADVIARVIWPTLPGANTPAPLTDNVCGRLEQSLDACTHAPDGARVTHGRVLIALANVGVLFHSGGEAKNGQVLRILHLLEDPRYAHAPIDFVVFCDEAHVPRRFRLPPVVDKRTAKPGEAAAKPGVARPWSTDINPRERYERPNRLALGGLHALDLTNRVVHIHAPGRSQARDVAQPFLAQWLGPAGVDCPLEKELIQLHRNVGGNRIALTLLLALCHEDRRLASANTSRVSIEGWLQKVATAMAVHIHEAAPETAIQLVFDRWALLHLRRPDLLRSAEVKPILAGAGFSPANHTKLLKAPGAAQLAWTLSTEILWHLAVLSHPVELAVLDQCPGIVRAAQRWIDAAKLQADETQHQAARINGLVQDMAELCVFRCLAMRMAPRRLGSTAMQPPPGGLDVQPARYTVHRMVQRYFMRMMGGRNIEAIEWDQFTTSLYASQPDEIPALSAGAHAKLKGLISSLARYAQSAALGHAMPLPIGRTVLQEFQALRAAYFVARSTYSVGVLSHIATQANHNDDTPSFGHMEEYRRLIRWITHRAQTLEQLAAGPAVAGTEPQVQGYFHRGEIVWLYAECGVMSLTQGKLEDAESLLNLAMQAARRIECDDTGSLRVRLLLHVALTHIERGQPRAAKRLLDPIAKRRDGHEMPPLIAEFYLGIIDHLGGEYHAAYQRYDKALSRLRALGRTRAAAFVLKSMADLQLAREPGKVQEAAATALEAMALAQRGGHEDVRMLAMLTLVRIRTKGVPGQHSTDSYRLLENVERYAIDMGMPRIQAAAHEVRATLLLSQGETRQAAREATSSAEIAALYDLKLFKCKALLTLANILMLRREFNQAAAIIHTGLEMAHAAEYFTCVRGFRSLLATAQSALDASAQRTDCG